MLWEAALLLGLVLVVFSVGRSPVFRLDRAGAGIVAAALMIALGVLTFDEAIAAIDFRTIAVLFFMMVIIASLKGAGFFALIGYHVLRSVSTKRQLLLAVILASGLLSAVAINDIVCLLFTPIVLLVCRQAGCDPKTHLLGVALAANISSAATFLGNPQNILIASLSRIPFASYFLTAAPIALLGLAVAYLIVAGNFQKDLQGDILRAARPRPHYHRYLIFKSLLVLALVIAGYVAGQDLAVTSSLGAAALLLTRRVKPGRVYASIDFNLLVIFVALFVVVGGVEKSGLMAWMVTQLGFLDFGNPLAFTGFTIFLSNLISNVPAVLLLKSFLPAAGAATWWKALALFSTFAGNLTITGSVANLIVVELARRENVRIGFWDYLKVGLPVTLATSGLGLILLAW